jgi:hypothetical protein
MKMVMYHRIQKKKKRFHRNEKITLPTKQLPAVHGEANWNAKGNAESACTAAQRCTATRMESKCGHFTESNVSLDIRRSSRSVQKSSLCSISPDNTLLGWI